MKTVLKAALIIIAAGVIFFGYDHSNKMTLRNISSPSAVYMVPYDTHGGTVYISPSEQRIMWFYTGLSILVVVTYGLLMLTDKKKSRR